MNKDKALFEEHMQGVTPLKKKALIHPKIIPQIRLPHHPRLTSPTEYFLSDYIVDPVMPETLLSYAHPKLAPKRLDQLRQGKIPWNKKLDLHGLNTEKARIHLCRFVQNQVLSGNKCVLIIHGKGSRQGETPVIKNLVNRWLPQFNEVLAFCSAQPKDGGSGAIYVLLTRNLLPPKIK